MDGETKKILIVDDDEFLLKMYALKFEAEFEYIIKARHTPSKVAAKIKNILR